MSKFRGKIILKNCLINLSINKDFCEEGHINEGTGEYFTLIL